MILYSFQMKWVKGVGAGYINRLFFLLRSGVSEVDLSTYFLACIALFFFFQEVTLSQQIFVEALLCLEQCLRIPREHALTTSV